MKIELKFPFQMGDKTISSVTLRRAKAKDMRVIARHGKALTAVASGEGQGMSEEITTATLSMIASMTDLEVSTVDEIDIEDINVIAEAMNSFFPKADSNTPVIGG